MLVFPLRTRLKPMLIDGDYDRYPWHQRFSYFRLDLNNSRTKFLYYCSFLLLYLYHIFTCIRFARMTIFYTKIAKVERHLIEKQHLRVTNKHVVCEYCKFFLSWILQNHYKHFNCSLLSIYIIPPRTKWFVYRNIHWKFNILRVLCLVNRNDPQFPIFLMCQKSYFIQPTW